MKVLLVGNYDGDGQESMQRFAQMLYSGLRKVNCQVELVSAPPVIGHLLGHNPITKKWLGYADKYLFFPPRLKQASQWADIVHICDQGNAMYLNLPAQIPGLITCHDLLAIRAALGEDTACRPSLAGSFLQRWILKSLQSARTIVCDSLSTQSDVHRLVPGTGGKNAQVIHVGLSYPYGGLSQTESSTALTQLPQVNLDIPYLLHVGSNEERKNRQGALRILALVRQRFNCNLIFAGQPLTDKLRELVNELKLADSVIEVAKPSNELLEALYSRAFAFVFPSLFEGFGWPVIEAQACGCPVICSNREPLIEVSGGAALFSDVNDEAGFAEHIIELCDNRKRTQLVQDGVANSKHFTPESMVSKYLQVYESLIQK